MANDKPLGRFAWYDLMTTDPDAAIAFYTKVVGWGTMPFEGAPQPYTMWTNGEAPIGGVMQLPKEASSAGAPPHWLSYVSTPDIDATVEKAQSLGANVMVPPTEIPNVGHFAVIQDPQGAVIAVYTSAGDAPGHDGAPRVGEFSWHELMTADYEAGFSFYSDLFGWEFSKDMDMGEAGIYRIFQREGVELGGMMTKPAEVPVSNWMYYARVEDVHATVKDVADAGGQIVRGPMEVPGGTFIAVGTDPQGAVFALHSAAKG